jgi:MYXO-CTERM domain-containing protein
MNKRIAALVATALIIPMLLLSFSAKAWAAPEAQTILYEQNFDSGSAPEWALEPGWEIAASQGGYALKGSGHVWARLQQGGWIDTSLTFRVLLEAGNSAVHANIRQIGPARYFIGINRQDIYLSKQLDQQTFKDNLARVASPGTGWHTIEISAVGDVISIFVDSRQMVKYRDPDPLLSGGVAFESLADQPVWIDDVVLTDLSGTSVAPPSGSETPQAGGSLPTSQLKWVRTGGPLGGLGYDVRMRPDNPDVMFVTDARAGVFKSLDGGKTWSPVNSGITTRMGETGEIIPDFCLSIDPLNPDIVWTGTQSQTGAFKSTDGGETWKKMDKGIPEKSLTLRGFTVDPRSSDIVYAAGEISSWEWSGRDMMGHEFDLTKGVVYKTTDGGQNWERIWEGDNLARYIWIDPRNPQVLYVSTGIFDREAANSDYASWTAGGVGVIKSLDGGQTWQPVNNGLGNLYIGSLFMHPTNPDILLAGAGAVTYPEGAGVYLTTDGGATWKKTLDAYVISSVEFASSNPKIAYAGDVSAFYRSEDGGNTWRQMTPDGARWGPEGVSVGTPIDFQVDPRNPDRVFVNAYGGGNFVSEDGGASWQNASKGYTGAMVRDIAVDPQQPGRVYAASRSGIFVSQNGGEDWAGIASGEFKDNDWHAIAINPSDPSRLLSEQTCNRRALYSSNSGRSWIVTTRFEDNAAWLTFEFAPSDPQVVYAGTAGFISCGGFGSEYPAHGIYTSQDGGMTLVEANDANTKDAAIAQLAIHPQDPLTVFAASFNKGLLKTSDGGKTWQSPAPELFKGKSTTAVRLAPDNPNLMFAGRSFGGLLRSEDGGDTWKISASGLNPEATVVDIVFDPTNPQVIYLADLFSGVYRSTNSGATWLQVNNGLDMKAINALALSSDGLHLYAASEGRGVFRLDLNGQPPQPAAVPTQAPTAVANATSTQPPGNAPGSPTQSILPAATSTIQPTATTQSGRPSLRCLSSPAVMGLAVLGGAGWLRRRRNLRSG